MSERPIVPKTSGDQAVQIGVGLVLCLILANHWTYLQSPFLKSFDIFQLTYSLTHSHPYPYLLLDALCEIDFAYSGLGDFPLLYLAITIAQLSLVLLPPLIIFKSFFSVSTLIYFLIYLASWKTLTYSFSLGIIFQYLFPISLALLLYGVLQMLVSHWQFQNARLLSAKGLLLVFGTIFIFAIGLFASPRFSFTIFASLLWISIRYIDHQDLQLKSRQTILLGSILALTIVLISVFGAQYNRTLSSIFTKYITYPPTTFFQQLFKHFSWTFVGIGPFLPLLLLLPHVLKIRRYLNLYALSVCLFSIIFVAHHLKPDFLKEAVYISYFSFFFVLGFLCLNKESRNGPAGFLFLNFAGLFFLNVFLLMSSWVRDPVFISYLFIIIALQLGKLKLPSLSELPRPNQRIATACIGLMVLTTAAAMGGAIYSGQKALDLQTKINKANHQGWRDFTSTLQDLPEMKVYSDKELIWNLRSSLRRLVTHFSHTPSEVAPLEVNLIPYFTLYNGPFFHRPFGPHHTDLYVSVSDIFTHLPLLEEQQIASKVVWTQSESPDINLSKPLRLSKGTYYIVRPKGHHTVEHPIALVNAAGEQRMLDAWIDCPDFQLIPFHIDQADTAWQIEHQLGPTLPNNWVVFKKANHLRLDPQEYAFAYQSFTDFFYSPAYFRKLREQNEARWPHTVSSKGRVTATAAQD